MEIVGGLAGEVGEKVSVLRRLAAAESGRLLSGVYGAFAGGDAGGASR